MNFVALMVSIFLSNGITCSGLSRSDQSATTPTVNVSVCLTSTESICGMTYAFIPVSGKFRVNGRSAQLSTVDVTQTLVTPFFVGSGGPSDLGFTTDDVAVPPSKNKLLATYNITLLESKKATSYSFQFVNYSNVIIDVPGQTKCGVDLINKTVADWQHKSWERARYQKLPVTGTFTINKK